MAQIKTIDREWHEVMETKEQLDEIMATSGCVETGIVRVTLVVTITTWAWDGEDPHPSTRQKYEPASFVRENIIMYR